jgi:FdhD protein
MKELITRRTALRFHGDRAEEGAVSLVHEVPFTIFLNGEELVTLLCTGHFLEDLAVGFLRSEGLIDTWPDVKSIRVDEDGGLARVDLREGEGLRRALHQKRALGSGCGRASLYYQPLDGLQIRPAPPGPSVTAAQVRDRMGEMNRRSSLYREARGSHNAALATVEGVLVNREDIGRHNAVDMIVGRALREDVFLGDKLLLTTGRASSEIVLKAARVGIPVLVSRSAATHLGVAVAEKVGMTLIGYVRGGKMIVYSHPKRVEG